MGRLDVQIPAPDGHSHGTLHVPDGDGPWPGVLVFPDAGGARETFGQMGDRLAGLGYVVLVPDIYYRSGAWENYNAVSGKYDLGHGLSVSAELGRQSFGTTADTPPIKLPDYIYGNIGWTYVHKSLSFDVRFH